MKYASEMGSGAMMHIQIFIKIGSAVQKLIGGIHRHTDSMVIAYAYCYFFKTRKVG
jgi:hypothetical protein